MYAPVPRSYWVDPNSEEAHIVDSYGEPGPIVRKPLCEETDYASLVEDEAEIPAGVWVEDRNEHLNTQKFRGVNPEKKIRHDLCSTCKQQYLELLWTRPVDYPVVEVQVKTSEAEETYMVADVHYVSDDDLQPCVQLVDELGRTKQLPMQAVSQIIPHSSMPVVY